MALTIRQVEDVCLANDGWKQCRYLDEVESGDQWVLICKKLTPDADIIDEEVDDWLNEVASNGQDPRSLGKPLSINCDGYIKLLSKPQGYDVKD